MSGVLIIDANRAYQRQLSQAFADARVSPEPVPTVAAARDHLRAGRKFDLIAMDCAPDDDDALAFLAEVRAAPATARVPVCVVSDHLEVADRLRALDAGATDYHARTPKLASLVAWCLGRAGLPAAASECEADREPRRVLVQACTSAATRRISELLRGDGCDVACGRCCDPVRSQWATRQPPDAIVTATPPAECTRVFHGAHARSVSVIFTGSDAGPARVGALIEQGADDFLPDTTDDAVFVGRVRAHVRRKRARDSFAHAQGTLDHAATSNRVKSTMFANMSREIRTPLSVILGFAEMLLDAERDPARSADLRRIHGAGVRLNQLIDEALDFAQIADGKLALEPAPAPIWVAEVLEAVASVAHALARRNGNEVRIVRDATCPPTVRVDPRRLNQILLNLVSNAARHTHDGAIDVCVRGEERDGRPQVVFDVRDTGIGIPAAKLAHLFEPEPAVEGPAPRRYGGAGLTLTLTRGLARRMGGDVSATSTVGEGTTFTVRLPVEAAAPSAIPPI